MRATFDLKSFRDAFKVAQRCVPPKSPKPELACVRLECDADSAVLAGTNLEASASARVHGAAIAESGVVLIDGQRLGKILQAADPDAPLDVERIGLGPVRVESGDGLWELDSFDPDKYPAIPGFPAGPTLTVEAHLLHKLIRRTAPAADDTDSSTWTFTACRLSLESGEAVLAANDRNSFAIQRVPATGELPADPPLVPGEFLAKRLLSSVDPAGPAVDVAFEGKRWAAFRQGDVVLTTRLAEGRFRDPTVVLGMARDDSARIAAGDLRAALKAASVTVSETTRALIFDFGPDTLAISSVAAGVGRSVARLHADCNDAFRVIFAADYLPPVLAALGDEDVLECRFDAKAPALFACDGLTYLLAPMDPAVVVGADSRPKRGAA